MNALKLPKLELFEGCRLAVGAVAILSLAINVLMLSGPLFMLQVYDRVLASGSVPTLVGLSVIVGVCYLFMGILTAFRGRILGRIGKVFDARLSSNAYRMAINIDHQHDRGNEDVIADFDRVRSFIASPALSAIFDLPWIPIYLSIIFLFSPWLGLTTTIGAIILVALMIGSTVLNRPRLLHLTNMSAQRTNLTQSTRQNAEVIRGMGMGDALTGRWQAVNNKFVDAQVGVQDISLSFNSVTQTLRMGLQSAILAIGAYLVIFQEISPGVMIAASILSARALAPLEQAIAQWNNFINARISLKRLGHINDDPSEAEARLSLPFPKQRLSAIHVTVRAPNSSQVILKDVNFSLSAGQALAVVGPSGSGKSTLARALTGIWTPAHGAVRADAIELNQWSESRRGQFVGYLPQDIQMFDGTIADNISRFKPGTSPSDIIEASKLANAHDLIVSFPDGYDTLIGPNGRALSGGQLQRLGLARAFFGLPFIIVLDEPNSNLDKNGEEALEVAIDRMRQRGSVVILITHRPRILNVADFTLVVEGGKQVAFGPSDEVLPHIVRHANRNVTPQREMRVNAAQ